MDPSSSGADRAANGDPGTDPIGTEDVLAEHASDAGGGPAEPPVPQDTFRHLRDYVALGVIVLLVLTAVVVLAATSDEQATESLPAPSPIAAPQAPTTFPPSLGEVWRASSAATPVPVATGTAVVTADHGAVQGRDPVTGEVRWSYTRNLPLCTVATAWSEVLVVYATDGVLLSGKDPRNTGGCSEVSTLTADTGARDSARNGDAELGTRLVYDGTYVTTTGPDLLDTWRSDLVQTMEYGVVPALVNAGRQRVNPEAERDRDHPNSCTFGPVAAGSGLIAVIERCSADQGDRLSVYRATGKDDADRPDVTGSVVVGSRSARVVAVNGNRIAVALPDPQRLLVFDEKGAQVGQYPLDLPDQELRSAPREQVVSTATGPGVRYWFTGSRTIALEDQTFRPLWTVKDTLGPGVLFAGKLLVPTAAGIDVRQPRTGAEVGTIPVNRDGYAGPVEMATEGPIVLEQRGATLVALR